MKVPPNLRKSSLVANLPMHLFSKFTAAVVAKQPCRESRFVLHFGSAPFTVSFLLYPQHRFEDRDQYIKQILYKLFWAFL